MVVASRKRYMPSIRGSWGCNELKRSGKLINMELTMLCQLNLMLDDISIVLDDYIVL